MKPAWDDVNARARGLGTRLLGRARLSRLRSASSLNELVTELEREGYPLVPRGGSPTAFELERSIRRNAQQHLAILARWCGARSRFLRFVFEDEDRRSLRALLRGAVEGVSWERRLSGLVPTPSLGERALEELSRLSSPSEIAATLTAWGSPYGESMRATASKTPVDLFALDLRVNRVFAARAMSGVRCRGRELREIARETIDLENALAAIVLSRHASGVEPEICFI
ncbi:MAG TPA: V-type ATPase subunit, partial [Vicinamibacteria bacterium]|nr:V-type ATPase subunit [Vicinamibacteria bacterium]